MGGTELKSQRKSQGELMFFLPLLTWSPAEKPYAAGIPESSSASQSPTALWQHPCYTDGGTD